MVLLLNCSFRSEKSNSNYFLKKLEEKLNIKYEHENLLKMKDKTLLVYVISNLGFYDSKQIHIQLDIMKNWCDKMNINYGGGLAIGAGEMLAGLNKVPIDKGPNKFLGEGLQKMADKINNNETFEDIYVKPYKFPRWMYMLAAGRS